MPRPRRRDDVLRAASTRFFRDGITATGIDRIIEDAGVAKMTLYSNFASKQALVVAYLTERDARFFSEWDDEVARHDVPRERAMVPVSLYRKAADEEGFHGCAFVNAGAELPPDHPGRQVIVEHKRRTLQRWATLLDGCGVDAPDALARECFLLLEGALVHTGVGLVEDGAPLDVAASLIRDRIDAALAP